MLLLQKVAVGLIGTKVEYKKRHGICLIYKRINNYCFFGAKVESEELEINKLN